MLRVINMNGFYTPDLAMADVPAGAMLRVVKKEYDPRKDMVYWEFERIWVSEDSEIYTHTS